MMLMTIPATLAADGTPTIVLVDLESFSDLDHTALSCVGPRRVLW